MQHEHACPRSYLEEDLVAVQVLGLPAGAADGAAGLGQQRDQLANLLHAELQHGRGARPRPDPRRQLLQGQLHAQAGLCRAGAKA